MTKLTRKQFIAFLKNTGACHTGLYWAKHTRGTPTELVEKCKDGRQLYWLVNILHGESKYSRQRKKMNEIYYRAVDFGIERSDGCDYYAEVSMLKAELLDNWTMVEDIICCSGRLGG